MDDNAMGDQATTSIKHKNEILTFEWKDIYMNSKISYMRV